MYVNHAVLWISARRCQLRRVRRDALCVTFFSCVRALALLDLVGLRARARA